MPKFNENLTTTGYFEVNDLAHQKSDWRPSYNPESETFGIVSKSKHDIQQTLIFPAHYSKWTNSSNIPYASYQDLLDDVKAAFFLPRQPDNISLEQRIEDLENATIQVTHFQAIDISITTTGSISFPSGSVLNEKALQEDFNAYLSTLGSSFQPEYETPISASGIPVTANLDNSGNYTSSDTFIGSVGIVYIVNVSRSSFDDWTETERNGIIDAAVYGVDGVNAGTRLTKTGSDSNPTISVDPTTDAEITANTAKRTYPLADENKLASIEAGAEENTVDSVFSRIGDITAQNDDYRSDQITVATLGSSYYNFDFSGYGTLRDGRYRFQTTGNNITGSPFTLNASAIYNVLFDINNNGWHSTTAKFSTQGDFLNQNREFERSGQTFTASQGLGWNERILQPQYEFYTTQQRFENDPLPGQTTAGLINNTTAFEVCLAQTFTPRRTGNFSCTVDFFFSLNDAGQDFLGNLGIFQGTSLVGGLNEIFRKEPKDTASTGVTLNTISAGAITGSANTSTNQRDQRTPGFEVDLIAGTAYELRFSFACSAANDLAAIYFAKTSIKENLTT